MFKSLQLKTEVAKQYTTGEEDNSLNNLSRVNIFIGPNNSGKSRFMRDLFIDNNITISEDYLNLKELRYTLIKCNDDFENFKKQYSNYNITHKIDLSKLKKNYNKTELYDLFEYLKNKINNTNSNQVDFLFKELSRQKKILKDLLNKSQIEITNNTIDFSNKAIYIPILRGLRSINYQNEEFTREDFYFERTKFDYFKKEKFGTNLNIFDKSIFTGLSLYDDVQELLLGNHEQRELVEDFEIFLSKTFFQNKKITIIPRLKEKDVYINIEGEKEDRPIYNLGEGVQAIIILTYPLFFNKGKNLKIYIEEPDVYLHPGFQRILIETLLNTKGFEEFQYFFTTHSNHFLDMTLDYKEISVYKFTKEKEQFHIHNIDNPDITLLEHLGVKNSSVFLTNCTIWVEGITDRIYIRKYLELYQESLSKESKIYFEDVHYSFIEYGGNNITHWNFIGKDEDKLNVERLCGKLFLITDDDGVDETKKKGIRLKDLNNALGNRYYRLKAREIENLLTDKIILETVKNLEIEINRDNIKYKSNYSYSDDLKIGDFILNNIDGIRQKSNYKKGGTINNKVPFAQSAIQQLKSFNDLGKEAQDLTKKIYNFIKENN
ncbi:ATP-dependent nuclease [Empedobacter brevis]|uniref:ATP-dependent nuclease n=1 Tax=Empedobacter brevis TaxID=247 RepID=UPI0028987EFB|nr:AAA family ATPase [Empedobacter brevis]